MIDRVSKKIAERLKSENIITDQVEIYQYGLELVISSLISILLCLVIGTLLHGFEITAIFLLGFVILRNFTGGYHATSHFNCSLTMVIITILLRIYHLVPFQPQLIIGIISLFIINKYAPMENVNKRIEKTDISTLHRNAMILSLFLFVTALIQYQFKSLLHSAIIYILVTDAILIIIEEVKQ